MADINGALRPTRIIDSDSELVAGIAGALTQGCESDVEKAERLFYYARDAVAYNVDLAASPLEEYRASRTIERREGYCTQKAVVLAALARAAGVPALLAFADVENHLISERLQEMMKTNLFVYHGYTKLWLNGRWVKATPAFDLEMCVQRGFVPVEFDGVHHAVFHPCNKEGTPHIKYLKQRGDFEELPFDEIMAAFRETYVSPGSEERILRVHTE